MFSACHPQVLKHSFLWGQHDANLRLDMAPLRHHAHENRSGRRQYRISHVLANLGRRSWCHCRHSLNR